jgi:hypothetical protein
MLRQVLVLAALLAAVHGAAPSTNAVSLGSTHTIAVQVAGCCFFEKNRAVSCRLDKPFRRRCIRMYLHRTDGDRRTPPGQHIQSGWHFERSRRGKPQILP